MSRFVNVPNGNYFVKVSPGGIITLDTGIEEGEVRITGDLIVEGTTTTINSQNLTIEDNIIELNKIISEDGNGDEVITIPDVDESGVKFNRNNAVATLLAFNENITWRDPTTETTKSGGFVFKDNNGSLVGLRTNSISTGGGDLYLINSGLGVLSVTGTTDYEERVFSYSNGSITGEVNDDDIIPNTKSIVDYIDFQFDNVFLSQIGDGEETVSSIIIRDTETTGVESLITFSIDAVPVSRLYADRWEFDELRFIGPKIETMSSDVDMVLSAPGPGSIRIDDTLHINSVPGVDDSLLEPLQPDDGVKIYVTNQSTGKTGIYFINADGNRDEIVSKNRSLLFSMLF